MQTLEEKAFLYLDGHFEETVRLWKAVVSMESPFFQKAAVDALADHLETHCRTLGLCVRRRACATTGDGLVISAAPDGAGIALMAHMDTVHKIGAFGDPAVTERDGWLYGPGAGDCKGGLVMALYTLLALRDAGYAGPPVKLILVGNEEGGRPETENFLWDELAGCRALFNCETGAEGSIVTSRKASIGALFRISGTAGHVGRLTSTPASAIREAAYKILDLEARSDYENIVFSCGEIQGGSIFTSVPDSCTFKVNCRIRRREDIPALQKLLADTAAHCRVPGTSATVELTGNIVPMFPTEGSDVLFARFNAANVSLGYPPLTPVHSGGGSDASYAAQLGVPVICATGPVAENAHTLRERANIESLRTRARIHIRTILSL